MYTFHLRHGVTFSDGTALDAAAVKFNLDRILDPKTTSSYAKSLLGPVDTITAQDQDTLVIRFRQSFAPLLQGLSLPYLGIQSPSYLQKATSTTNTVVGSGPFVLESFVKGSGSRLTRRADYAWGPGYAAHTGAAHLDAIAFRYLPESAVRLGALSSGQVQAIDEVPPANFRALQADPKLSVITRENPGVNRAFFLNTSKGPFADVTVRRAFQSALDVAGAVKLAYFGSLQPADNIVGPSFQLAAGEILALVGESGSGKSTLERVALALQRPDGGEVRLEGAPWSALQEAARRPRRRRIQVIVQDPLSSFDPRFTVARIIEQPLRLRAGLHRAARRERVLELIGLVGLQPEHLSRRPGALSGGQRQRVSIA